MEVKKECQGTNVFVEKEYYREKIMEISNKIEDEETLKKIYTVAKTHMYILEGKERG